MVADKTIKRSILQCARTRKSSHWPPHSSDCAETYNLRPSFTINNTDIFSWQSSLGILAVWTGRHIPLISQNTNGLVFWPTPWVWSLITFVVCSKWNMEQWLSVSLWFMSVFAIGATASQSGKKTQIRYRFYTARGARADPRAQTHTCRTDWCF